MTVRSIVPTLTGRLTLWVAALLISASSFVGCECINKLLGRTNADTKFSPGEAQIPPPNQVNLQLTGAAVNATSIVNAFHEAAPDIPIADIQVQVCPCDKGLVNVSLPGNYTIIIKGAEGPLAVQPPPGATGGDVDLPFSMVAGSNFSISPLIEIERTPKPERPDRGIDVSGKTSAKIIQVAVFDTGLNPGFLPGTNWQQPTRQCSSLAPTSVVGWNFTIEGAANQTTDATPMQHGSRVAHLVARQFNGSPVTVKIIPMKVLKANLEGDLFGLLCAMETARKNKISIFNMSLGYYGPEDPLLKQYVERALTDKIKIVAAAGNRSAEDSVANVDRNFDTMTPRFYPAGFGSQSDGVIAVTTAHLAGDVLLGCGRQNYGPAFVLGVLEEVDCRFILVPNAGNPSLITGSSYATPVLAGWLARQLVEVPGQVAGRASLPVLMTQATRGQQLFKNAYIKSQPPLAF